MTHPYVDETREAKSKRIQNINKRTNKDVPEHIFRAHHALTDQFPDASTILTPAFVFAVAKEIGKAIEQISCEKEDAIFQFFGFGKFKLIKKKIAKPPFKQFFLKFYTSDSVIIRIRQAHGTATASQLKVLENGKLYVQKLKEKREARLQEKELKSKGLLGEGSSESYVTPFADILRASLD